MIDLSKLAEPFKPEQIHWRVGATNKKSLIRKTGNKNAKPTKGIALAYIDARDLMDRLDEVVGPENWQCRYPHGNTQVCEIGIRIDGEWVWKANAGDDTDVEAVKGRASDSFKRAGVLWGPARYLYGLDNVWCDLDDWGKIKKHPNLPKWALPSGSTPQKKAPTIDVGKLEITIRTDLDSADGVDAFKEACDRQRANIIKMKKTDKPTYERIVAMIEEKLGGK